jgi:Protein of unknown function (DUF3631)
MEAGCDKLVIAGNVVSRTGDPPRGYKDIDAALAGGVPLQELRDWLLGATRHELSLDGWARKIGETIKDPLRQAQEIQKAIDQLGLGRGMVGPFRKQVSKYAKRAGWDEHEEQPQAGGGGGSMVYRPIPTAVEPQDGLTLANDIAGALRRHARTPETAITICTLWLLHAERRQYSTLGVMPRLIITAPTEDSGKTHLALALQHMMERCEHTLSPRPANIYRTVDKYGSAFILDEADQWYRPDHELQELIDAGYNRDGSNILRTVETVTQGGARQLEPQRFNTFAPLILVGIDLYRKLARQILSRGLVVEMHPAGENDEIVDLFDNPEAVAKLRTLAGRIKRFLIDAEKDLRFVVPEKPAGVINRLWLTWRPLLALAQYIGDPWPARAIEALTAARARTPDAGTALQLLRDTYLILSLAKGNKLHTTSLIDELLKLEMRPYMFFGRAKAVIRDTEVARLLGTYGVRPKQVWINNRNKNGYTLDDLMPAVARYSPSIVSDWAADGVYGVYASRDGSNLSDPAGSGLRPPNGAEGLGGSNGPLGGETLDSKSNGGLRAIAEELSGLATP